MSALLKAVRRHDWALLCAAYGVTCLALALEVDAGLSRAADGLASHQTEERTR